MPPTTTRAKRATAKAAAVRPPEQHPEAYEVTVTVDDAEHRVMVQPLAAGGFEVVVPMAGRAETVSGETEAAALSAAQDRIRAAATGEPTTGADEQSASPAAPDRAEYEKTIAVGDRTLAVVVRPRADEGFDVLVPIEDGTSTVYGDTEEIALEAARDRFQAAATEFAEDRVTHAYGTDVEVMGATYDVAATQYASGKVLLVCAAFPEITLSVEDELAGLARIAERIGEHLGVLAARTVNGKPGEVMIDEPASGANGDARKPDLGFKPEPISLAESLRRLAEAEADQIDKDEIASRARSEARKANERVEAAKIVMRAAAEREVKPELELRQPA